MDKCTVEMEMVHIVFPWEIISYNKKFLFLGVFDAQWRNENITVFSGFNVISNLKMDTL